MSPKRAQSERPWMEWTNRDDRAWLTELASLEQAPAKQLEQLGACLDSIVTSLFAPHHSRWGQSMNSSEQKKWMNSFLEWLNDEGALKKLKQRWSKDKKGPWSLPLFLSRAMLRYQLTLVPRPAVHHAPHPKDPQHEAEQLAAQLSGKMVDAFTSLAQHLPEEIRLSYQLHLEGLLNPEIAALLNEPLARIEAHIAEAKELMKMPRSAGA